MCGRPHTLGFVVQNVFLCLGCLLILKAVIDRGIYFRECFGWTGPLKGTMHWNSSLDMWQRWQTARAEARQVIVTHLSLHYMLQQAWQINHWGERTRVGRSGWGEKNVKRVQRKDKFTPDSDFFWGSWCLLSSAGILQLMPWWVCFKFTCQPCLFLSLW